MDQTLYPTTEKYFMQLSKIYSSETSNFSNDKNKQTKKKQQQKLKIGWLFWA